MVGQSDRSAEVVDLIERALERDKATTFDEVDSRECSSDRFRGVQVNIYGEFVNARPIIDAVAEVDSIAIEEIQYARYDEPHLGVFVAYLTQQDHPAFV